MDSSFWLPYWERSWLGDISEVMNSARKLSHILAKFFNPEIFLRLYTEFQCPTLPGTGAGGVGGVVWWFKPIIVLSLEKAEQFCLSFILRDTKLNFLTPGKNMVNVESWFM